MSDLIERQAAIEVIDKIFPADPMRNDYTQGIACGAALAKTYVEQLPSAQPERPRGEWINRSLNILYPDWERYTCSACGKHAYNYDFCPNCGADMRGEQE